MQRKCILVRLLLRGFVPPVSFVEIAWDKSYTRWGYTKKGAGGEVPASPPDLTGPSTQSSTAAISCIIRKYSGLSLSSCLTLLTVGSALVLVAFSALVAAFRSRSG